MKNHELLRGISTAVNFKPKRIAQPAAWVAHMPFAAALVSELKPKLIVELGTHSGNSYFTFCQAVQEAQLDTTCYAIDTWEGDAQAGWYDAQVYQSVLGHNNEHYSKFSYLLRDTFDNSVSQFSDESIDLLHIDGLHTYEACKHDYETWLPKVKKGGVILFHDISARHEGFGVWKLWEEIKNDCPHTLSFVHSSGLGVLINDQNPLKNKFLADLLKPGFQNYIQLFGTLGSQIQTSFTDAEARRIEANIEAQLYVAGGEDAFAEERSMRQTYAPGKIVTLRFENIRKFYQGDVLRLRFDPACRPCKIHLLRMSLVSADKDSQTGPPFQLLSAKDITGIVNIAYINTESTDFITENGDPQLYLAPAKTASQGDLAFEVELVATADLQEIARYMQQIAAEFSATKKTLEESAKEMERFRTMEHEMERMTLAMEESTNGKEASQARIRTLEAEGTAQGEKMALIKQELEQATRALEERSKEETTLRAQIQALEYQMAGQSETLILLQKEKENLALSIQSAEFSKKEQLVRIASLEQQHKTLQAAQKESSEKLKTKDNELGALKQQLAKEQEAAEQQRKKLKESEESRTSETGDLRQQMQAQQAEASGKIREADEREKQNHQNALLAETKIKSLNQLLDETRGDVAQMRSGILWRMAAPFRAMSRLLSPTVRKHPRNQFFLDAPNVRLFAKSENPLHITGWFVDTKGRPAHSVRVRTGNNQVICECVERPDVVAHIKAQGMEVPDGRVGFNGKITTSPGLKYIVIEAERQTGGWVPLRHLLLRMPEEHEDHRRARLGCNYCLDSAPRKFFATNPFTFAGWFFDKQNQPAKEIRVKIGKRVLVCPKTRRPDLFKHFRNLDWANSFGFDQTIKTGIGLKHITLEVEMLSGETMILWKKLLWMPKYDERADPKLYYKFWAQAAEKVNPPQPPPENGPLISVLMPVYNTPEKWLRLAIESVRKQTYPNWEFCIADDASPDPRMRKILEEYEAADKRIKVVYRKTNGHISTSSNSALEICSGSFTALLDHDDELPPYALAEVANVINNNPNASLIYSDEDKIDENGLITSPYFKSDWNYQLFLGHNMISHLGVYRTSIIKEIGGFRVGLHGSQDYDLALRVIERIKESEIYHIPKVLYHWRILPGSTSLDSQEKPYAMLAGERAINEHFARIKCDATSELIGAGYRTHYALKQEPKVSIIIPTKNNEPYLRKCIESLFGKTAYKNYEVLIIDNGSTEPVTVAYLNQLRQEYAGKLRIIEWNHPFNYSAINNFAVKQASGAHLCFLNDDIEIISPDWLAEMVSIASQKRVGAVGACLWYPDWTLQHAGIILGLGEDRCAGHAHCGMPKGQAGYFSRASLQQEFSAVTAACLVVRKAVFDEIDGFNETELTVAYNDVDLCLRLWSKGYKNIWTPFAELIHHESASRGAENNETKIKRFKKEIEYMKKKWQKLIENDPAYNPNLSLDKSDFSLAWPIRHSTK